MKPARQAVLAMATTLALSAASALLAPHVAHAQSTEADRLFRQGVTLFERKQLKAACDKFGASYAIDPASGTLFNLASCHERIEHWAEARQEFLELATRAAASGARDKAQQARDRAHAAETHLPRLALRGAREHGFDTVTVDGKVVEPAEWTAPVIVSAGDHVVEARGAGKPAAHLTVTALPATETPVDLGAAGAEAAVSPSPAPAASDAESAPPSHPWRTAGWITGGAGVALLAGGAVFGALALSKKHDGETACASTTGNHVCPTSVDTGHAQDALDSAHTDATLSTVGIIVGAAAVGVGAYLVLRPGPSSLPSAGSLRLGPLVGRDGGGATLGGSF